MTSRRPLWQLPIGLLPPSLPPEMAGAETAHLHQADQWQHNLLRLLPHCNSIDYNLVETPVVDCSNLDFAAWRPLHMRSRTLGPRRSAPGSSSCLYLFHSLQHVIKPTTRCLRFLESMYCANSTGSYPLLATSSLR